MDSAGQHSMHDVTVGPLPEPAAPPAPEQQNLEDAFAMAMADLDEVASRSLSPDRSPAHPPGPAMPPEERTTFMTKMQYVDTLHGTEIPRINRAIGDLASRVTVLELTQTEMEVSVPNVDTLKDLKRFVIDFIDHTNTQLATLAKRTEHLRTTQGHEHPCRAEPCSAW